MLPTLPLLSKHLLSSTPFKRAQTGLFHGSLIQFGNNVPFSKHKTRRTWLPNVQNKDLYSDLLRRNVRVKVTTRALRTIRKYGGLDGYILNTPSDVLGPEGMRIRIMLRNKQERLASLGPPERTTEDGVEEGASTSMTEGEMEGSSANIYGIDGGLEEGVRDTNTTLDSRMNTNAEVNGGRARPTL